MLQKYHVRNEEIQVNQEERLTRTSAANFTTNLQLLYDEKAWKEGIEGKTGSELLEGRHSQY